MQPAVVPHIARRWNGTALRHPVTNETLRTVAVRYLLHRIDHANRILRTVRTTARSSPHTKVGQIPLVPFLTHAHTLLALRVHATIIIDRTLRREMARTTITLVALVADTHRLPIQHVRAGRMDVTDLLIIQTGHFLLDARIPITIVARIADTFVPVRAVTPLTVCMRATVVLHIARRHTFLGDLLRVELNSPADLVERVLDQRVAGGARAAQYRAERFNSLCKRDGL